MSDPDLVPRETASGYEVPHGVIIVPGAPPAAAEPTPSFVVEPTPVPAPTAVQPPSQAPTIGDLAQLNFDTPPDAAGPYLDSDAKPAAALWALLVGIAFLMLGNGLQGILIGVRSQTAGFSALTTGLVMTAYFCGFLAGTRTVQTLLNGVGHIRVFAALASMASASALIHTLSTDSWVWIAMRFATGFCMSGLFIVEESWINDLATNKTRGRLLAAYMVVTMGSMAVGQFLLNVADPNGFQLFVLSSVLISFSLVPVTLSATSAPPMTVARPMSMRSLAEIVPTGLVISFLVGVSAGALLGMGAVYATAEGLSPAQVAVFMSAPMIGGVVFQFPIGWISDHVPRRGVILVLAIVGTAASVGLWTVGPGSLLSYGLMVALGGVVFPLYSLGIAYTNDWLEADQILGASAALVAANGVGAVFGPLITATVFAALGTGQFFAVMVATYGLLVAYLLYRVATAEAPTVDEQGAFVPFPARASAQAAKLLLRRRTRPRA